MIQSKERIKIKIVITINLIFNRNTNFLQSNKTDALEKIWALRQRTDAKVKTKCNKILLHFNKIWKFILIY